MSDLEQRLQQLEARVVELAAELRDVRQTLELVGDVQRFTRLRQLLDAAQLDDADRETARLLEDLLATAGAELGPEALARCPAPPLLILDGLWRSASGGRQGFAVQLRRYQELGGSRDSLIAQDAELFHRFSDAVGWPLLEGVGFALPEQLQVPVAAAVDAEGVVREGHLPLRCWASDYGLKAANLLMVRLIEVFAP